MTTLATSATPGRAAAHVVPPTTPERPGRALAVRRGFLVAAPVLAGLLCILGAVADPAAGISGTQMHHLYTAHPGPLQWKSTGFHWAYALWIAPALLIAPYVRRRGAWIANVAALLGLLGMTTLPGMLISDWFESAIGQAYGNAAVTKVDDLIFSTMWGPVGFMIPGMVGFFLALPIATIAMVRAGRMRWYALAPVVLAYVAFMGSGVRPWGTVLTALLLSAYAVLLARATRPQAG